MNVMGHIRKRTHKYWPTFRYSVIYTWKLDEKLFCACSHFSPDLMDSIWQSAINPSSFGFCFSHPKFTLLFLIRCLVFIARVLSKWPTLVVSLIKTIKLNEAKTNRTNERRKKKKYFSFEPFCATQKRTQPFRIDEI